METRNPFATDINIYHPVIDDALKSIEDWDSFMQKQSSADRVAAAKASYFSSKIKLLTLRYSRGDKLTDLKNDLNEIINDFIIAESSGRSDFGDDSHLYTGLTQIFFMQNIIALLTFSLCLSVDKKVFFKLLSWLQPAPESSLIDRIVSHFQPDRNFEESEEDIEGKYELLIEAINAPVDLKIRLLEQYLNREANNLSENLPEGVNTSFDYIQSKRITFQWCFEVALVVKMFDLDDCSLLEIPNYPGDLVIFSTPELQQ